MYTDNKQLPYSGNGNFLDFQIKRDTFSNSQNNLYSKKTFRLPYNLSQKLSSTNWLEMRKFYKYF